MPGSKKALADFLSEAQEIMEAFSANLLKIDFSAGEPDPDVVNTLFRGAHSLKGLAGMFGVSRLAELAHHGEDLLDALRMGRARLSPEVADLLLELVNVSTAIIGEVSRSDEGGGPRGSERLADALEQKLKAVGTGEAPQPAADPLDSLGLEPSVRSVLTEYEEHRLRENVRKGSSVLRVRARFNLSDFDTGLAQLNARLKPAGEVISTLPSPSASEGGIAFDLILGTREPVAGIQSAVEGLPAEVVRLGPIERAPGIAAAPAQRPGVGQAGQAGAEMVAAAAEDLSIRSVSQTVRVDIAKLDRLMNMVGDLVVIKTDMQRLTEGLRGEPQPGVTRVLQGELAREGRALERKLNELQAGILEVRMVPLEQVFDKLARLVRKIARDAGKELDLKVSGGEVELDKLIVEELSDPLMHLIRNAIDHGIEAPQARVDAGKPRRGVVALDASQKGNHVEIIISDDGAGIDVERVRQVAVERGLVSREASHELSQRDLYNFIFTPGFSTASQVSELSGRGVGMDVVKTNIANLSGIIDVHSEPGQGTQLSITLPETLAIMRALLVDAGEHLYAMPLNGVLEILEFRAEEVRTIEGREMVTLRGQSLPLVRLARLFRHRESAATSRLFVVVVGLAQDRLGIGVTGLRGQQDIIIKPLGEVLGHVPGIAGATDLGSRRTVLVLDIGGILDEVLTRDSRKPGGDASPRSRQAAG